MDATTFTRCVNLLMVLLVVLVPVLLRQPIHVHVVGGLHGQRRLDNGNDFVFGGPVLLVSQFAGSEPSGAQLATVMSILLVSLQSQPSPSSSCPLSARQPPSVDVARGVLDVFALACTSDLNHYLRSSQWSARRLSLRQSPPSLGAIEVAVVE